MSNLTSFTAVVPATLAVEPRDRGTGRHNSIPSMAAVADTGRGAYAAKQAAPPRGRQR